MENARLSLMYLMFFAIFALNSSAQYVTPDIDVISGLKISNTTYYTPYPVEPDQYFDLYVRVQAVVGSGSIQGVSCKLEPTFPFSIDNGETTEYEIGTLASYQEALMKFKIRVDQNAVTGTNNLKMTCSVLGYADKTVNLPIYVQAQDAIIQVSKVFSSPTKFNPSEVGTVTLQLDNIASISLKDITVNLDLSGTDIPFAPINETTEKRIALIEAGRSANVTFNIIAFPDAVANTYKIPITLNYHDALGKNYSKETLTSFQIETEQNIMMVHDQTTIVKNGSKNIVAISIINKAMSKVTFMTATIGESPENAYTVLSPTVYYIGDINSDDSETAEFELFVDTNENRMTVPITIEYRDGVGNSYTETQNVNVNVFSKDDAIKYGYEKAMAIDPLLIGIFAVIVIYVAYKYVLPRFRKKKKTEFSE